MFDAPFQNRMFSKILKPKLSSVRILIKPEPKHGFEKAFVEFGVRVYTSREISLHEFDIILMTLCPMIIHRARTVWFLPDF